MVLTVDFVLHGQQVTALNGRPQFTFDEAISFVVHCEDQEEVDRYWSKLAAGGEEGPCGWCKDRFGLSWQVVDGLRVPLGSGVAWFKACAPVQAFEPRLTAQLFARWRAKEFCVID